MASLEIIGLEKLVELAEKYPTVAEKHIGNAIRRSLVRIWGAEKQEAPFGVSGSLRDRWTLSVNPFRGFLKSQMSYSRTINEGGVPDSFPTASQLAPWAAKKGLNPYAVAKGIKKRGHIIANPFWDRTLEKTERDVQKEFSDAIISITKEIV